MTDKARWTLLVYMCGDNDLDRYGVEDIEEMLSVGTTHEVRVVVQFDRRKAIPGRYLIPESPGVPLRKCRIKAFKKLNSADPKILAEFITWGRKNYPADRLGLVLWDHGNGWLPLKPDNHEVKASRTALRAHMAALKGERTSRRRHPKAPDGAIAHTCYYGFDHGAQHALDMLELKQAITKGLGHHGHLDLLAFDACHMAQLEVAYQLRGFADVLVGSEEENPFQGWPYDIILKAIANDSGMDAEPLGIQAAKAFLEYVRYPVTQKNGVTQSVLRMARIDALAAATDRLGNALASAIKEQPMEVHAIVAGVQRYLTHSFADLGDLALLAHTHIKKVEVQEAAAAVIQAIGEAKAFSGALGDSVQRSTGISVYVPPNRQWFEEYRNSYSRLDLSIDHPGWFQFLKAYHAGSGQLARESGGLAKVLSRVDVLIPIPIEDI